MDPLKKIRDRIDWLDGQIALLLNERMRASEQVGKIKRSSHKEVVDSAREERVLHQVENAIQHPLLKANIGQIYREIMKEASHIQQFFRFSAQPFTKIGFIGLGLMGGSIAKALKTKEPSLFTSALGLSEAVEGIDRVFSTMGEFLHNVELVILASPHSTIIPYAEEIQRHSLNQKILVMDIASVKGEIASAFAKLTRDNVEYVATHPMAGKEKSGCENSLATLFVNRPWIIVPHKHNSESALQAICALILFLGGEPMRLQPQIHDHRAALVSQLPSLLSKWYWDFVHSIDSESQSYAGPGFHSFTRLAHDNPALRAEFLQNNRPQIRALLEQWLDYITTQIEESL